MVLPCTASRSPYLPVSTGVLPSESTELRLREPTGGCELQFGNYPRQAPLEKANMTGTPANYVAFTAPINSSSDPQLTLEQVWALLRRKIRLAEDFVPVAIASTEVVSESSDEQGRPVTTRVVTFREGNRRVEEVVTTFYPMKVEFRQPDGSRVMNIVSKGANGELFMTYTFEWLHAGLDEAALAAKREKEEAGSKMAVEGTIKAMREMVADGRWKETA